MFIMCYWMPTETRKGTDVIPGRGITGVCESPNQNGCWESFGRKTFVLNAKPSTQNLEWEFVTPTLTSHDFTLTLFRPEKDMSDSSDLHSELLKNSFYALLIFIFTGYIKMTEIQSMLAVSNASRCLVYCLQTNLISLMLHTAQIMIPKSSGGYETIRKPKSKTKQKMKDKKQWLKYIFHLYFPHC